MSERMACSENQGDFLSEGEVWVLHIHPQLLLQELFVVLKHRVSLPVCEEGIPEIGKMVLKAFFEAQRLYEWGRMC